MQRVKRQIGAPSIQRGQINGSYNGRGITVAVLDSGIGIHPDLSGRLLCFRDFVNGRKMPYDDCGHGTHVCGIICGNGGISGGQFAGMAPEAELVVGKVLDDRGDGCAEHMLQGLRWVSEIREKYEIRILNISVGIGNLTDKDKEREIQRQLDALWDSGVIVICAAGNKGPASGSISALGSGRRMITVGCHDGNFFKNNPHRCESYSGRGEALSPIRKPDVVAPGTHIVSCNAFLQKKGAYYQNAYVQKSGTSMATPIVCGAAALTLEKFPLMQGEEFRQKLTFTATDLGAAWNQQGWGMVNVKGLLA